MTAVSFFTPRSTIFFHVNPAYSRLMRLQSWGCSSPIASLSGSQDVAGTEAFGFATDAWGCRAGQWPSHVAQQRENVTKFSILMAGIWIIDPYGHMAGLYWSMTLRDIARAHLTNRWVTRRNTTKGQRHPLEGLLLVGARAVHQNLLEPCCFASSRVFGGDRFFWWGWKSAPQNPLAGVPFSHGLRGHKLIKSQNLGANKNHPIPSHPIPSDIIP